MSHQMREHRLECRVRGTPGRNVVRTRESLGERAQREAQLRSRLHTGAEDGEAPKLS